MGSVKFYIEIRNNRSKSKDKDLPIYLYYTFDKKRFQYNTGLRTDVNLWDRKKQKVKASAIGAFEINMMLEMLSEKAYRTYREARLQGFIPSIQYFKTLFSLETSQLKKSFFGFYKEFLEDKALRLTESSLKKYNTNYNHLKNFQRVKNYTLEFSSINDDFFKKYLGYMLNDLGHTNNTINRNLKVLKTFLNWASQKGYNLLSFYKNFHFRGYDGEVIYLTRDELIDLYNMKFINKRLERVRDAFCFGCFTGLRFSDVKNLKKQDVRDGYIRSYSIKTKDQLSIPLNPYSRAILEKYKRYDEQYSLPVLSNQRMNEYLKEIGKLAGLDTEINIVRFQGAKRIEKIMPKYELLTTHIARKTFVTLAFQKNIPAETIMKITNHKKHDTLKRYMKIEDKQQYDAMQKIFG